MTHLKEKIESSIDALNVIDTKVNNIDKEVGHSTAQVVHTTHS